MANKFVPKLDYPYWVPITAWPNAHAVGGSLCCDLRNDSSVHPYIGQLVSNTVFNEYNTVQKALRLFGSPALAGTFGAGAGAVFAPSQAAAGTIAGGATTTSVVLSTALPAAVGLNMLAGRGDGYGYRLRIIGSSAGGSGLTEEREIMGNTIGTTPTITVSPAFTFTPASGNTYELLSGRYFCLGAGTTAAGSWKSIGAATNAITALGTTNLPATIGTDSAFAALDELYVPWNHLPGEGLVVGTGTYDTSGTDKRCLTATATAAGTITGQASAGDAGVATNEYRNYQIRIVEDTAIPTAVGQRRIIASHTAGASPVYTLGVAWAVQPTATAKFVIENPNLILLQSTASTSWFTYNYSQNTINNGTNSINANAWSTTYFAAAANAHGAGVCLFPSWGIQPDAGKNARHSFIYRLRGGGVATVDVFDIAGGATGAWTAGITVDGAVSVTTGSCGKYAPCTDDGHFAYFNSYVASQISQIYRFNVKKRVITPVTPTPQLQAGTAVAGDRIATYVVPNTNDTEKYTNVLLLPHLSAQPYELTVVV